MVTLLNFEKAASKNAIVYLKRQQFVTNSRQQIKDGRKRWEERKKRDKVFVKVLNDNICIFYCKTYILYCKTYFKI